MPFYHNARSPDFWLPQDKPVGPVAVNMLHPLAPSAYWFCGKDGLVELVRCLPAEAGSNITEVSPFGISQTFAGRVNATTLSNEQLGIVNGISVIVKFKSSQVARGIVGRIYQANLADPYNDFSLYTDSANVSGFRFTNSTGTTLHVTCNVANTSDGNWHYMCGTWDGTTITTYADNTSPVTGSLSGVLHDSGFPIAIGGNGGSSGDMVGSILYFGIWPRALSAVEVASLRDNPYSFLMPAG